MDNISDAVLLVFRCIGTERTITTRRDNSICSSVYQIKGSRFYRSTGIVSGVVSLLAFFVVEINNFNFLIKSSLADFRLLSSPVFLCLSLSTFMVV